MSNNNDVKSVFVGWFALAVAFVCGKKYGYNQCASKVKDVMLKGFIEKAEKEEKGS